MIFYNSIFSKRFDIQDDGSKVGHQKLKSTRNYHKHYQATVEIRHGGDKQTSAAFVVAVKKVPIVKILISKRTTVLKLRLSEVL